MGQLSVSQRRSALMATIPSRNTRPELLVRRVLHRMGYRFRIHQRSLPGTPDIVLRRYQAVILIHGCFWHQHRDCPEGRLPRARTTYWWPKLARNVEKDEAAISALNAAGWRVLVIWACEVRNLEALEERLRKFLPKARRRKGINPLTA
jgi:DNA mismatch endonuclease (patch repair protein)